MLRGKTGLNKTEVKKKGCVSSFLLLEQIKNLLVSKYFLAHLGYSVKTTNELKTQLNLMTNHPIFQLTSFRKNQWSLSGGSKNP